jgi:hypothetical protein
MLEGRKAIGGLIAEGQRRGEINPSLKPPKVALQLLQGNLGTFLLWSLHEKPSLETWIEDTFQHFWRSIAVSSDEQEP